MTTPEPRTTFFCPADGTRAAPESLAWCCPACGGPWDLDFTPAAPVPLKSLAGRVNSLWRYAEALPFGGAATPSPLSLGEGRTPLVALSGSVSAKLDFLMPTLSFKDRGAVMLAELARRLGPDRVSRAIADSSGNAGTAIAAYCARAGLPCTVYAPEATSPKKTEQIRTHGAHLTVVPGDREATAAAARAAAAEPGTMRATSTTVPGR
ncbi:threonine synthase [Streptomyces hypolithicus]